MQRNIGYGSVGWSGRLAKLPQQLVVGQAHIMTLSWRLGPSSIAKVPQRYGLMIILMLIAGLGCLLAGLLAIGLGIPVKEFSFGNTLILTGAVLTCTGLIILAIWVVVRELRNIAERLGPDSSADWAGTALQPTSATLAPRSQADESGGYPFSRDQPAANGAHPPPLSPAPWLDETAARDRHRREAPATPEPVEAEPASKPRRNLMFSSISRKERERAQARVADQPATDPHSDPAVAPQVAPATESPPATFEDAWPNSERPRSSEAALPRRAGRAPSTFSEGTTDDAGADRQQPTAGSEAQPPVTVLKSGVVDGMAYSLYSDGSIEAQMPEGMMRFASIDELRAHLDQRP